MKITAWKCPHTGKLFEKEKVYNNHMKRLSRERIAHQKWQDIRDSVRETIAGAKNVGSAQELVDYIIANEEAFMIHGTFNDSSDSHKLHEAIKKGYKITFPKLRKLSINTKWSLEVSNSHNCPRDGYTNWSGSDKDKLRHYPGWHGKIGICYAEDDRYIYITNLKGKTTRIEAPTISDIGGGSSSLCGINTGSGGGGLTDNSYGVSLFQSDFPLWEEAVTFAILSGDGTAPTWGNSPSYKELDALGVGKYDMEKENV